MRHAACVANILFRSMCFGIPFCGALARLVVLDEEQVLVDALQPVLLERGEAQRLLHHLPERGQLLQVEGTPNLQSEAVVGPPIRGARCKEPAPRDERFIYIKHPAREITFILTVFRSAKVARADGDDVVGVRHGEAGEEALLEHGPHLEANGDWALEHRSATAAKTFQLIIRDVD